MVDLEKEIFRVVMLIFVEEPIGLSGTENMVYLHGGWHLVSLYTVSELKNLRKKGKNQAFYEVVEGMKITQTLHE